MSVSGRMSRRMQAGIAVPALTFVCANVACALVLVANPSFGHIGRTYALNTIVLPIVFVFAAPAVFAAARRAGQARTGRRLAALYVTAAVVLLGLRV